MQGGIALTAARTHRGPIFQKLKGQLGATLLCRLRKIDIQLPINGGLLAGSIALRQLTTLEHVRLGVGAGAAAAARQSRQQARERQNRPAEHDRFLCPCPRLNSTRSSASLEQQQLSNVRSRPSSAESLARQRTVSLAEANSCGAVRLPWPPHAVLARNSWLGGDALRAIVGEGYGQGVRFQREEQYTYDPRPFRQGAAKHRHLRPATRHDLQP